MDEEIKGKLEEMAHDSSDVGELVYTARGLPVWRVDEDKKLAFMAGAQAAWDLAVKHERERIAGLINFGVENMERFINHNSDLTIVCEWHRFAITQVKILKKAILNPPTEESGT